MQYALVDNEKVEATPKMTGRCQLCELEVFSKCGEVNIWHWSHKKHESCDGWYEPETEWHRNWKIVFGKENSEIVIKRDGVKHIADILTSNEVVIELQNSPIRKPDIRKREFFYGVRMLWILNGQSFKQNFSFFKERKATNIIPATIKVPEFINTAKGWVRYNPGDLPKIEIEQTQGESFSWSWARKSWSETERPVFIDFGEDDLFWVKRGMGTCSGIGKSVRKEAFIKKYGGNMELINIVLGGNSDSH